MNTVSDKLSPKNKVFRIHIDNEAGDSRIIQRRNGKLVKVQNRLSLCFIRPLLRSLFGSEERIEVILFLILHHGKNRLLLFSFKKGTHRHIKLRMMKQGIH